MAEEEKVFGSQKSNKEQARITGPFKLQQEVWIYITINKPLENFKQRVYVEGLSALIYIFKVLFPCPIEIRCGGKQQWNIDDQSGSDCRNKK